MRPTPRTFTAVPLEVEGCGTFTLRGIRTGLRSGTRSTGTCRLSPRVLKKPTQLVDVQTCNCDGITDQPVTNSCLSGISTSALDS